MDIGGCAIAPIMVRVVILANRDYGGTCERYNAECEADILEEMGDDEHSINAKKNENAHPGCEAGIMLGCLFCKCNHCQWRACERASDSDAKRNAANLEGALDMGGNNVDNKGDGCRNERARFEDPACDWALGATACCGNGKDGSCYKTHNARAKNRIRLDRFRGKSRFECGQHE